MNAPISTATPNAQLESPLVAGNSALRSGNHAAAVGHYLRALQSSPALGKTIGANLVLARQKYRAGRTNIERASAAICGWELADNAAGRVYALAKLYETFADVEIIGSIFPVHGRDVWEPIRNTRISKHIIVVDDQGRFIEDAIELVAAHPYDIVHLSKLRAPNIFFGILYKLIWDAKVLVDIDDEELPTVGAESSISLDDFLNEHGNIPVLGDLPGKDWTRLAVGLAKEFDGITVSNPALQQRYGGEIICHTPLVSGTGKSSERGLFETEVSADDVQILARAEKYVTLPVSGALGKLCEKIVPHIFLNLQLSKQTASQAAPASQTIAAVAPASLHKPYQTIPNTSSEKNQELDDILATELCGEPQRFFKTFDAELEAQFLAALFRDNTQSQNTANVHVSIVMPTYNRAHIIEKALVSVLAQTHKNWELIIVDDGSTDKTSEILRGYANDARIRVVQGEHRGVSAARNKGLQQVTGAYVFYLDSDNTWSAQYLQTMIMMFLYSRRRTGYCATSIIDHTQKTLGYRGEAFNWAQCLQLNYIDLNVFAHESTLIQENGTFDETLRRMVDWDLILRYTKNHQPFYAPFIGCTYLEDKNDPSRITLSEPLAFKKVIQFKNGLAGSNAAGTPKALRLKFAIKIPAPYEQRHEWGDFHYADSLRVALEDLGHSVDLDFHGQWYKRPANCDDVVIVIRGLTAYKPSRIHINILWNISHPDQVSFEEYESFDHVYVASLSYASFLGTFLKTRIKPLLQCSDPTRFYYQESKTAKLEKLLFVGNSRNEYRPIVRKAIDAQQDIEIFGTRWQQFVHGKYIGGENIPNDELRGYYASYGAVLNDHWESMRVYGFVSNRIFDVLAAGGSLISDSLPSISRLFGDAVTQIADDESFEHALQRLQSAERPEAKKRILSEHICTHHSFGKRAKTINEGVLERLGLANIDSSLEGIGSIDAESSARPKVGLLLQNGPLRPTSSGYIRLIAPLTTEQAHARIDIVLLDGVQDSKLLECSAVIVQRVAVQDRASADLLLRVTQQHAIALYVDIDDAFAALPDAHPEKDYYQRLDQVLRHIMQGANHVWFSTAALARLYRQDYRSGSVVPNTLDPRLWRNYRKPQPCASLTPKFHILFMGTATHDADFTMVLPALDALAKTKGRCFEVTVVGALRHPPQREWLKVVSPPKGNTLYPYFARWLANSGSYDIGIAPLVDDIFNECKSDIKFLDYSALGIPTICSRSGAYQTVAEAGLVLSCDNTTEQWLRALTMAIENRELMLNMVSRSWDYLWGQRSTESSALQLLNYLSPLRQTNKSAQIDLPIIKPGPANRVAVCIHLYYIHRWAVIRPYLDNLPGDFDLYVTCQQEQHDAVSALVHKDFPSAVLVSTHNQGMDVLPFLHLNYEYGLWRYDAVLKLHTKNDQTQDDDTLGRLCLDALLGSKQLVAGVLHELLSGHRVGMVGPEILYRSATRLMYANGNQVRQLVDALGMQYPEEDWGFFAGTMFWIHGALLRNLAMQFQQLSALASQDSGGSTTAGDGTWAHAMERIFGAMPSLGYMEIAVTYPNTLNGQHLHLRRINAGELAKNAVFRNGSRAHLLRYRSLHSWYDICKKSGLFDSQYYTDQAGSVIPPHMDPVVHFLLYADDLSLDPSSKFSTSFYKKNNGDVVKIGMSTLIHYLVNGKKEGRKISAASK